MGNRAVFFTRKSNFAIRNTIPQTYGEEALLPGTVAKTDVNSHRYFKTASDLAPGFASWTDYGIPYDVNNVTLNGAPVFASDAINNIKKISETEYFFSLPEKSALEEGDVLKIGGTFKFMEDRSIYRDGEGKAVSRGQGAIETPDYIAHKVVLKEESFVWDGDEFILKADYDAAQAFDAKVEAIGTVTLDSEEAIVEAREIYDALSDGAKAVAQELDTLEAAETRLEELKTAKEAAEAFDAKVEAIGTVTLDSEEAIVEARTIYQGLSDDAKSFVTKLNDLVAAENQLDALKLDSVKSEAKAALDQIDLTVYRQEDQATIQGIIKDAKEAIDNATNSQEVNAAKAAALDEIAKIKTAEEIAVEELAAAKAEAKAAIEAKYDNLTTDNSYADEDAVTLFETKNDALASIDAANSIEEVNRIKDNAIATMEAVPVYVKPAPKKGCGGSIAMASGVSLFALAGIGLLAIKRKKEK